MNKHRYPTISKLARDVLGIQETSVARESVFSDSGNLVREGGAHLHIDTVGGLMLTRL